MLGAAWWRTQYYAALWRPSPAVRAHIEAQLTATGAATDSRPYLSWHVRRGDKIDETYVVDAAAYVPRVLRAAASSQLRRVFVASDDPAVTAAAPAQLPSLDVASLPDGLRLGASGAEAAERRSRDNADEAYTLALDAIANIWALSEGSVLVGLYRSNFARLAADLMYAKGHAVAAFEWLGEDAECHACECAQYYWSARYWATRAARVRAGLPPGIFGG